MSKLKVLRPKVQQVPELVLEKAECDLPLEAQMHKAARKVDESLVQLTQNETLFALTVLHQLGSFARRITFTPQMAQCAQFEKPECFALNVSPNAPVTPLPFSEQAMFNGLIAVPLPASTKLTLQYFGDSRNRVLERLHSELDNTRDLGCGDPSNFVGFYSSSEPGVGTQFWCVAQCHSTELSLETSRLIAAAEPESLDDVDDCARRFVDLANKHAEHMHTLENYHVAIDIDAPDKNALAKASAAAKKPLGYTSWSTLFLKTARLHEIRRQQREHRLATVRKALAAIGVQLQAPLTLESPSLIESTFNCVDQVNRKEEFGDLVYLSRMSSINAVSRDGVLFCDAPNVGVSVLRGPWATERVAEQNKQNPLAPFIGVPIGTGWLRTPTLIELAQDSAAPVTTASVESMSVSNTHFWQPSAQINLLFDVRNCHSRSKETKWKPWLEKCGYSGGAARELPLTPICVRWAQPPVASTPYAQ